MLRDVASRLPDIWSRHARTLGDKPAIIFKDTHISWAEFGFHISRAANALHQRGMIVGKKIATLLPTEISTLTTMCGVIKSGACLVPLSSMLSPEQIATLLQDSQPDMLIIDPMHTPLLAAFAMPPQMQCITTLEWQALQDAASKEDISYAISADDPYNIIYSSGTTGLPKGIVQSHRARFHWSWSNALEMGFRSDSISLVTTALYSNGTMFMVLPPLFVGGTIILMEKYEPAAALNLIAAHCVSHVFMVPAQAIMTLELPDLEKYDLSSLKVWLSAGSALRAETRARLEARVTPHVFELYGFSEGFATMRKPWDGPQSEGSVGRPVLGFDMRILDDDGNILAPGEKGEIAGTGDGLMTGYHNNPKATEALIWRDTQGRVFLRSGDIGTIDEMGCLHILERKKDMIVSGGFNVFPADIEAVLATHPDVLDVTVIGVPHPKWDEVPYALIIARNSIDPQAIMTWANARLAKTQRLAGVEIRTEFPRNALGKVLKRILREPFWSAGA